MPKIVWKQQLYGGYKGYLGEIHLFTISLAISRNKNNELPWILRSTLPSFESRRIEGTKESELMRTAAELFTDWLEKIGFTYFSGEFYASRR